ncbi:LacI family DNA-binding transcriptional regulator [Terriglobus tenax]|uniref:LacI family DNA-binding transcriptional regulator n=1 Tax=Terriglobus tenax TaxID=1111115 RepID=UPI0021E0ADD3|nr:LacI family DNA-binding transcriptional regulator [Terriglobus tenax]
MKRSSTSQKRPTTLADVARLAEVSTMTASRAVNESGYVSDEVRRRVMKAAAKLGYRPNMLARQLKGRKLNAIGILLPDIANPFSSELVSGIKQVCDEQGFTTFIATSDRSVDEEQASLQSFIDHRVDGLIVATRGTTMGDKVLQKIAQQKVPLVNIGRPINSPGIDSVTANHYQGAFDAVQHLVKAGHRRIGFLGIAAGEGSSLRRYQGYLAALEQAGIKPSSDYTAGPPESLAFSTQKDGYEAFLQLAGLRRPPTAYFARNDFTALGAMHAARTLGLRIPHDIAIAGFDNIPLAAFAAPPLTTVEQPIHAQGEQAARFLLERIEQPDLPARNAMMACRLIVRESSVLLP